MAHSPEVHILWMAAGGLPVRKQSKINYFYAPRDVLWDQENLMHLDTAGSCKKQFPNEAQEEIFDE